jgi:hypothetical protein
MGGRARALAAAIWAALGARALRDRPADGENVSALMSKRFLRRGARAALPLDGRDMSLCRVTPGAELGRGRGMVRAAVWTIGLFALGAGICHLFPGPFVEPLVLLALGATLFFVSGRSPAASRRTTAAPSSTRALPTRAP